MSDWKHELLDAIDEVLSKSTRDKQGEWRSLGRVVPLDGDGWYSLDLRVGAGRPPSVDSLDQLCLADKTGPERGTPIAVERSQVVDEVLKVRVSGRLPAGCDILWTVRPTPQYLWTKLRQGIAGLDNAPLADKLAAGALDPVPRRATGYPAGFLPAQTFAYAACVEPGLHAVWGPPGTGKTRVPASAIEDLVKAGKRVLLVSTTNVAVDNALKEAERLLVQGQLEAMGDVDERLREADQVLANYDHDAHLAARARIRNADDLSVMTARLRAAESDHRAADEETAVGTGGRHDGGGAAPGTRTRVAGVGQGQGHGGPAGGQRPGTRRTGGHSQGPPVPRRPRDGGLAGQEARRG
ncbi:AAA domain-containing protein [Actinokineospora inagensis]|uniref:AAA domain-containing protein n=1 Tax=Actinokineospora inagensis TaxID=103730 RepID=UPI000479ABA8|nr:AAA domain-containing protein [Actinokineospora inagensis]